MREGWVMRLAVICGIAFVGLGTNAMAADAPYLRGSQVIEPGAPVYFRWDGAYYGAQAGYGSGSAIYGSDNRDLARGLLGNDPIEVFGISNLATTGRPGGAGASLGLFVGYNAQWDEAVLGVEFNYSHNFFAFESSSTVHGIITTPALYQYDITVANSSKVNLSDYATFRLRAGWAAEGFMPYGFIALATGVADVKRSATVAYNVTPLPGAALPGPAPFNGTASQDQTTVLGAGYAMGVGVDWVYRDAYFVRAEYEYTRFMSFHGADLNFFTLRTAVGVKF